MPHIRQRFAPLTQELGEDERFIIKSTDLDKLMYILVIYTCHMTHHQAPKDPKFYQKRFALRSKLGQIAASLGRLAVMYPKISWGDKNLSMLNSKTYKIGNGLEIEVEREIEIKNKVLNKPKPKKQASVNPFFWEFKKLYPNCLAFKRTQGAFQKLNVDEALWGVMRKAILEQKESKSWKQGFVPASFKWLEEERWRDTVVKKVESPF